MRASVRSRRAAKPSSGALLRMRYKHAGAQCLPLNASWVTRWFSECTAAKKLQTLSVAMEQHILSTTSESENIISRKPLNCDATGALSSSIYKREKINNKVSTKEYNTVY